VLPWAGQGRYVLAAAYTGPLAFPTANSPTYLLASEGILIHAVPGQFYQSVNGGASWTALSFAPYTAASCQYSAQNSYYYLSTRKGLLYTAFTMQRVEGTQHCLWAVNATSSPLKVVRAWALNGALCSATGEGDGVYALLCGYNYVAYSGLQDSSALLPVIGSQSAGYADGTFLAARLNGASSLVAHDSRLYIAAAGGTSIETAFYGNLSRLKARGVKQ
jgi:hypothetical protein